jgi:hypothetical protein
VSDQNADQTSGEAGSASAESAILNSSDAQTQPTAVVTEGSASEAGGTGSPDLLSGQGVAAETDATGSAPTPEAPKPEAPAFPGSVVSISAPDYKEGSESAGPQVESGLNQGMFGKRRLSAIAAVVALATVTGALGGALGTAGVLRFSSGEVERNDRRAVEAVVTRIEADVVALKASLEHTSKVAAQFNKAGDRLDRLEKAQAEPTAKIAKLSEAVDKMRATLAISPVPVSVPAASKEATGSIAPVAAASVASPKTEVSKLPTVEGWALRDVGNGGALIQSRLGIYEVYTGDAVPGLGRVDAIRRQDGRWVVVTSKGLIVGR